jgi:hypothetical protein
VGLGADIVTVQAAATTPRADIDAMIALRR